MSQLSSVAPPTPGSTPRPTPQWYHPTLSHEHGVYVMLVVSFLTGAAAAHHWTLSTTLALVCAFCGFQAEHPLVLQIKQRKSWKPRFLVWGSVYSGIAFAIALSLYFLQGDRVSPLLGIYAGAAIAFLGDMRSVWHREQKSIANELMTFSAVCLSAPLAFIATTGTITLPVLGLWLLNTLFFASAIFTVKFRKDKTHSVQPAAIYHAIATLLLAGCVYLGGLAPFTALAFVIALLKFGIILWQRQWYCTTPIQFVALLETSAAIGFLLLTALSVLPAHLPAV